MLKNRLRLAGCSTQRFLSAALLALAILPAGVHGETIQSELYQLDLPRSRATGSPFVNAAVYMRVSGIGSVDTPFIRESDYFGGRRTSQNVLFEFLLVGNSSALRLARLRFQEQGNHSGVLSEVDKIFLPRHDGTLATRYPHAILSEPSASPTRIPLFEMSASKIQDKTVSYFDIPLQGSHSIENNPQVIGVLFRLPPGEGIQTLIDVHLAQGVIRPEVELEASDGQTTQASLGMHWQNRVILGRPCDIADSNARLLTVLTNMRVSPPVYQLPARQFGQCRQFIVIRPPYSQFWKPKSYRRLARAPPNYAGELIEFCVMFS